MAGATRHRCPAEVATHCRGDRGTPKSVAKVAEGRRKGDAIAAFLDLVLGSCSSSSDVVPIGADSYAITVKSLPCGLLSAEPAKEVAQRTAADFCKANGKEFAPTETISTIGLPLVHCATVELRFRCGDRPLEN